MKKTIEYIANINEFYFSFIIILFTTKFVVDLTIKYKVKTFFDIKPVFDNIVASRNFQECFFIP